MSSITIPAGRNLCGKVTVISSKSELHRLIFCACLSDKECVIHYNSSLSEDINATISCFRTLGAEISVSENTISINKPLDFDYISENLPENTEIFCSESGSTARFLLPLVSLLCKRGAVMTGAGKLPLRPFSDLCECLSAHGTEFSSSQMPIKISGGITRGGEFAISGNISSQYLSGLLFILPLLEDAHIRLTTPLESRGYVDMTMEAMEKFGVKITEQNGIYTANGKYCTTQKDIFAGGDWSNAAFFLCGAKRNVTVNGLFADSLQPDKAVADILEACGFETGTEGTSFSVIRKDTLYPFDIDAGETPDLVPVLCVLASSINGKSTIRNIRRLKYKESDRVKAVCDMISSLGGEISADENAIYINGKGTLRGGNVCGYGDHRIVMSASVAASFCENDVTITDAHAVAKSYPEFFEILNGLSEEKA